MERVAELAAQVRDRFGQIDILVNNAGGDIGAQGTMAAAGGRPVDNDAINVSFADLRAVFDRNWLTCILPCREVAPEMMARQQGCIVNMGSVAGLRGASTGVVYGSAKAAVHHYTRCLAAQLREHGVRVNAVAPGEILSVRFIPGDIPQGPLQLKGAYERRHRQTVSRNCAKERRSRLADFFIRLVKEKPRPRPKSCYGMSCAILWRPPSSSSASTSGG